MSKRKTVADLVELLGGTFEVGQIMGVVPTAVSNAKAANRLPESWKYRLFKIVLERELAGFSHLFDDEKTETAA